MSRSPTRAASRGADAGRAAAAERARPARGQAAVEYVLDLQRTAGNSAVAGMVLPPTGEEPHVDEKTAENSPAVATRSAGADLWAAEAVARPAQVSWAAVAASADGAAAIVGPSPATLEKVQKVDGFNAWRLGVTTFPTGTYKVPSFDFASVNKPAAAPAKAAKGGKGGKGGKAPPKAAAPGWYSVPKLTAKAYEGDDVCFFVPAGKHKTDPAVWKADGGKPVFWIMPGPMAARDSTAEGEHSQDIKLAFKISLKEAERVLTKHIVGKTFGPKPTQADAEKLVLDTFQAKLAHPKLGNDKTKWGGTYETLYRLTLQRDTKRWHTFGLGKRKVDKAGNVTYTINKGSTNVGTVASSKIVKY